MKDLDINITGQEFFRIVKGEELHGLKFLKLVTLDQPSDRLSFFHRIYYFDWNGTVVCSNIGTVFWADEEQSFHTSFTHACGEPSDTGPKFTLATPEEISRIKS